MAKPYPFVAVLAKRIDAEREAQGLTYELLGKVAEVDTAQAWRICRGEFATLNPGVLRICNKLAVIPEGLLVANGGDGMEARLAAEAIAAWDRTEAGAQLLVRVLRALRPQDRKPTA